MWIHKKDSVKKDISHQSGDSTQISQDIIHSSKVHRIAFISSQSWAYFLSVTHSILKFCFRSNIRSFKGSFWGQMCRILLKVNFRAHSRSVQHQWPNSRLLSYVVLNFCSFQVILWHLTSIWGLDSNFSEYHTLILKWNYFSESNKKACSLNQKWEREFQEEIYHLKRGGTFHLS